MWTARHCASCGADCTNSWYQTPAWPNAHFCNDRCASANIPAAFQRASDAENRADQQRARAEAAEAKLQAAERDHTWGGFTGWEWRDKAEAAEKRAAEAEARLDGLLFRCLWCEEAFPRTLERLDGHAAVCPKHPLRRVEALTAENERLKAELADQTEDARESEETAERWRQRFQDVLARPHVYVSATATQLTKASADFRTSPPALACADCHATEAVSHFGALNPTPLCTPCARKRLNPPGRLRRALGAVAGFVRRDWERTRLIGVFGIGTGIGVNLAWGYVTAYTAGLLPW